MFGDLGLNNLAHGGVRLGHENSLVSPGPDQMFQTLQHVFRFVTVAACGLEQHDKKPIEFTFAVTGTMKWADIQAAARAQFQPALLQQVMIGGAYCVGVNVVAARNGANARELVASRQILAQDAEQHLSRQLFANRQLAVPGDPESHRVLAIMTHGIRKRRYRYYQN
jgi:hypothetical protein